MYPLSVAENYERPLQPVFTMHDVTTQAEILSTPLLQTFLSLPLHPLPENFLLHLLLPKRLRSLCSTL